MSAKCCNKGGGGCCPHCPYNKELTEQDIQELQSLIIDQLVESMNSEKVGKPDEN